MCFPYRVQQGYWVEFDPIDSWPLLRLLINVVTSEQAVAGSSRLLALLPDRSAISTLIQQRVTVRLRLNSRPDVVILGRGTQQFAPTPAGPTRKHPGSLPGKFQARCGDSDLISPETSRRIVREM